MVDTIDKEEVASEDGSPRRGSGAIIGFSVLGILLVLGLLGIVFWPKGSSGEETMSNDPRQSIAATAVPTTSAQSGDAGVQATPTTTRASPATTVASQAAGATTAPQPGEIPPPGSCVLLEERHCASGEVIDFGEDNGLHIGFRLPPGTPVFAPYGGWLIGGVGVTSPDDMEQVAQPAVLVVRDSPQIGMGYLLEEYVILVFSGAEVIPAIQAGEFSVPKGAHLADVSDGDVQEGYNLIVSFVFTPELIEHGIPELYLTRFGFLGGSKEPGEAPAVSTTSTIVSTPPPEEK